MRPVPPPPPPKFRRGEIQHGIELAPLVEWLTTLSTDEQLLKLEDMLSRFRTPHSYHRLDKRVVSSSSLPPSPSQDAQEMDPEVLERRRRERGSPVILDADEAEEHEEPNGASDGEGGNGKDELDGGDGEASGDAHAPAPEAVPAANNDSTSHAPGPLASCLATAVSPASVHESPALENSSPTSMQPPTDAVSLHPSPAATAPLPSTSALHSVPMSRGASAAKTLFAFSQGMNHVSPANSTPNVPTPEELILNDIVNTISATAPDLAAALASPTSVSPIPLLPVLSAQPSPASGEILPEGRDMELPGGMTLAQQYGGTPADVPMDVPTPAVMRLKEPDTASGVDTPASGAPRSPSPFVPKYAPPPGGTGRYRRELRIDVRTLDASTLFFLEEWRREELNLPPHELQAPLSKWYAPMPQPKAKDKKKQATPAAPARDPTPALVPDGPPSEEAVIAAIIEHGHAGAPRSSSHSPLPERTFTKLPDEDDPDFDPAPKKRRGPPRVCGKTVDSPAPAPASAPDLPLSEEAVIAAMIEAGRAGVPDRPPPPLSLPEVHFPNLGRDKSDDSDFEPSVRHSVPKKRGTGRHRRSGGPATHLDSPAATRDGAEGIPATPRGRPRGRPRTKGLGSPAFSHLISPATAAGSPATPRGRGRPRGRPRGSRAARSRPESRTESLAADVLTSAPFGMASVMQAPGTVDEPVVLDAADSSPAAILEDDLESLQGHAGVAPEDDDPMNHVPDIVDLVSISSAMDVDEPGDFGPSFAGVEILSNSGASNTDQDADAPTPRAHDYAPLSPTKRALTLTSDDTELPPPKRPRTQPSWTRLASPELFDDYGDDDEAGPSTSQRTLMPPTEQLFVSSSPSPAQTPRVSASSPIKARDSSPDRFPARASSRRVSELRNSSIGASRRSSRGVLADESGSSHYATPASRFGTPDRRVSRGRQPENRVYVEIPPFQKGRNKYTLYFDLDAGSDVESEAPEPTPPPPNRARVGAVAEDWTPQPERRPTPAVKSRVRAIQREETPDDTEVDDLLVAEAEPTPPAVPPPKKRGKTTARKTVGRHPRILAQVDAHSVRHREFEKGQERKSNIEKHSSREERETRAFIHPYRGPADTGAPHAASPSCIVKVPGSAHARAAHSPHTPRRRPTTRPEVEIETVSGSGGAKRTRSARDPASEPRPVRVAPPAPGHTSRSSRPSRQSLPAPNAKQQSKARVYTLSETPPSVAVCLPPVPTAKDQGRGEKAKEKEKKKKLWRLSTARTSGPSSSSEHDEEI